MKTNRALCGLALGCVVGTAQAATVTFDWAKPNPMDVPTNVASPNCNSNTDYCSTAGGSLNYSSGGVSVVVTAAANNTTGGSPRVIQDVVGDYGGLGVLTSGETGNLDQVGGGGFLERLILTFASEVNLTALKFYDDHAVNPSFTGHQFSVRVNNSATLAITNAQPVLSYATNLVGTTFEISNPFATPDKSWYLAGAVVETNNPPNNIPEPGTYALMLAGLAMLGMITRRRTKA